MYFITLEMQVNFYFNAVKQLPILRQEILVRNPATGTYILVKF
jgi:hypothetical protein